MKKGSISVLGCLMIVILLLTSGLTHAQTPKEPLLGRWTADMERSLRDVREKSPALYGELPDSHRDRLMESVGSRSFGFSEDGEFSASWKFNGISHGVSGKWDRKGEDILEIVLPSGTKRYHLQLDGPKKLVLTHLDGFGGIQQKLFFIKTDD